MLNDWRRFLEGHAGEWNVAAARQWTPLVNNNYHPHCSNLNVLWFRDGDQRPAVVTKLYHDAGIPSREFANLRQAYSACPGAVPRPLHFEPIGSVWALWMEGVEGMRFQPADWTVERVRGVVDVITNLHAALRRNRTGPEEYRRMVSEPLESVIGFGSSQIVRDGCAALAARITPGSFNLLPSIPQHGDLFYSNVLRSGDRWHIVDWELYGDIDIPFYDVFTLLLSMLRANGDIPEQWDTALRNEAPVLMRRYAAKLNVDVAMTPVLLGLTLVNWFHLLLRDGREAFTRNMYATLQSYFERPGAWEKVFG
jgi:hypothetical protein